MERKEAEDKKTRTWKSKRETWQSKRSKKFCFLKQQRKYLKICSRCCLTKDKSTANEDLLGPHANVDVRVKCLNSETQNRPLPTSWAYSELKNSWGSEFVRPLHSSSTIDPPPEATPALGYSRWGGGKGSSRAKKEIKTTQY